MYGHFEIDTIKGCQVSSYPKVGDQFGPFLITGEIGRGGMGVVFAARQQPLNRMVALKVLEPRFSVDPDFVTRFNNEANLLARMNSPHVVQVFDHGQIGDCLYLSMQLVTGGDLANYLKTHGPLSLPRAAALTEQVTYALADAHDLGIVHRDIKPSNVLLAKTGSELFAYLCDFGIAQGEDPQVTQAGFFVGSRAYSAPERHQGHPADVRSDLYSLGCLFWALVTGRAPYSGTSYEIAQQHIAAPVPQLLGSDPVYAATNMVFARLLAKDPNQRPASALEVAGALRNLRRFAESQGHSPTVRPPEDLTITDPPPQTPRVPDNGDTVLAPHLQTPAPATPAPATPAQTPKLASQTSQQHSRKGRTALIAVSVVLASALVGGGSLWAITTQFSSGSSTTTVAPTPPPESPTESSASPKGEVTTESEGAPEAGEDQPVSTPRNPATNLVTKINVGSSPHGIAVDSGSRLAFVANYHDNSVSVVNIDSNTVVRKINVGKNPQNLVVDPATGLLLVGCDGTSVVQIYDLQRYSLVGSVSTGRGPIRLAVHSSQKLAYAVAQDSSSMQVISLDSRELIRTVKVGANPRVIAVDERDQIAYIGHWKRDRISVVDLAAQNKIGELKVGKNPNTITVAPESRLAFVGNYENGKDGGGSVSVIDLDSRSVKKTIDVDDGPSRVAVDENANSVYLSCLYASTINVIDMDTLTVADRFGTADRPTGVSVDTSTGRLYLTSFDEHVVQIFES